MATATDHKQSFYSPPEIAKLLRVNADRVRQWITSGELQASNVGDGRRVPRWRVRAADFNRFLASRSAVKKSRRHVDERVTEHF